MVHPFIGTKVVVSGTSYGLSSASYDVRIAHDLTLGPNPAHLLTEMLKRNRAYTGEAVLELYRSKIANYPPNFALAHTVEDFDMPADVAGLVTDKSTYARKFLSAMNTFIDCGFKGNLTLELVNLGDEVITIKAGDPIVQVLFFQLDQPSENPYAGKYQHQSKAAHGARYE